MAVSVIEVPGVDRAIVSARGDVALRVLVALADAAPALMTADTLARCHGVSRSTVDGVLLDLSRAGLVVGVRGQTGGYRLGAPADELTLADVVAAVDRGLAEACGVAVRVVRRDRQIDGFDRTWLDAQQRLRQVFEEITVASVAAAVAATP